MARRTEEKRIQASQLTTLRVVGIILVTAVVFAAIIYFLRTYGAARPLEEPGGAAVRTAAAVKSVEQKAHEILLQGEQIPADALQSTLEDEYYETRNKVEECLLNMDKLRDGEVIQSIGGYIPSKEHLDRLNSLVAEMQKKGAPMGFVMIDIRTGQGIAYNPTQPFYSASSVKGPYMVSTIAMNNTALDEYTDLFETIGLISDNSCYNTLFSVYGDEPFNTWCEKAGTDESVLLAGGYNYTWYSAESLARLWLMNYQFFATGGRLGERAGQLFEHPNYSAIKESLGLYYHTRSKSGWINTNPISAVDSGIIYAGENEEWPFLCTILAEYGGDLDALDPYFYELERVHSEMVGLPTKVPPFGEEAEAAKKLIAAQKEKERQEAQAEWEAKMNATPTPTPTVTSEPAQGTANDPTVTSEPAQGTANGPTATPQAAGTAQITATPQAAGTAQTTATPQAAGTTQTTTP